MDVSTFDRENIELIAKGQVDEVERRLGENYEAAKASQDVARILHAVSALAHFYALPFKEDQSKAEHYFRKRYTMRPGADAALELVMFCYYSLQDPKKTLDETNRVRSLTDRSKAGDLRFLYTAVAIEGQAHLAIGQDQAAIANVEELLDMAQRDPTAVPIGDEYNLLEQMIAASLAEESCRGLLDIVIRRVRSLEYRDKAEKLLSSKGWMHPFRRQ
jgi:hypothetical protein